MKNISSCGLEIPVVSAVDVVVLGSCSGAVAAALEIKRAGRSVYVVSDRPYFGSESAGTYEYAEVEVGGDPLLREIAGYDAGLPLNPARIKGALDRALLGAGIPFCFLSRPVGLLRDGKGVVAGVVLAFRTSLTAVRCRLVLDMTAYGVGVGLSPGVRTKDRGMPGGATLVVAAAELPEGWKGRGTRLPLDAEWRNKNGEAAGCPLFRLELDCVGRVDGVGGADGETFALAGMEHRLRAGVVDAEFLCSADQVVCGSTRVLAVEGAVTLDLREAFDVYGKIMEGLYLAGPLLPLDEPSLARVGTFAGSVELGRHAGRCAGEAMEGADFLEPVVMDTGCGGDGGSGVSASEVGFSPAFVRPDGGGKVVRVDISGWRDMGQCDVLVAGGGTGGAPAAIAAARSGAATIVLEMQHGLGGVGTLGLIASYYFGNRVGFTAELDRGMDVLDPERAEKKNRRWNPELKMAWYHRALLEAGGAAWLGSFAFGVEKEGENVRSVLVSTPYGCGRVRVGTVVDATGNAAGHVAVQGTGLSPRCPTMDYRNTDHTFIDDSDVAGVTHAHVVARAKFAGEFDVSPLVDSRERRQIIGDLELSPLDILAGRTFPDTINTAESNFDTHGFTIHPVFMVAPPDKKPLRAHVPFRCLLPSGVSNVLVTGLGISAHRDAIPVVRMQADVQNQGYAAGMAAAEASARGCPLRGLDIRGLQHRLTGLGILDDEVLSHGDSFPLGADALGAAASGTPDGLFEAAVLFAHPEEAAGLLIERLRSAGGDEELAAVCATVLGLMGRPEGGAVLERVVRAAEWDEGWNYRGMGQFGRSMSKLDARIIALAGSRSQGAAAVIAEKAEQLGGDAEFSHCRAVAVAAGILKDERLNVAVTALLARPGVRGHTQDATAAAVACAQDDPIETEARNLALRELHLARGLYLGGDNAGGGGRRILVSYAGDMRGHFARHAAALLQAEAGGCAEAV